MLEPAMPDSVGDEKKCIPRCSLSPWLKFLAGVAFSLLWLAFYVTISCIIDALLSTERVEHTKVLEKFSYPVADYLNLLARVTGGQKLLNNILADDTVLCVRVGSVVLYVCIAAMWVPLVLQHPDELSQEPEALGEEATENKSPAGMLAEKKLSVEGGLGHSIANEPGEPAVAAPVRTSELVRRKLSYRRSPEEQSGQGSNGATAPVEIISGGSDVRGSVRSQAKFDKLSSTPRVLTRSIIRTRRQKLLDTPL